MGVTIIDKCFPWLTNESKFILRNEQKQTKQEMRATSCEMYIVYVFVKNFNFSAIWSEIQQDSTPKNLLY